MRNAIDLDETLSLASASYRDVPLLSASQSSSATQWWTDEEDKRVARKIDWLVIPVMFGCYTLSILDRNNLGNAKTHLVASLGLTDSQWIWLLMIFHISYVTFHSLLLLVAVLPPSTYIALSLLVWGTAGMAQSAATSWEALMCCRFVLGMAESAFSTGAGYYFSLVFPRHAVGFRFALFMAAGPFAGTWSGIFAWAILQMKGPIESWRILFFFESILTILFVPVVWCRLPDSVHTAHGLSPRERKIAAARLTKYGSGAEAGIALLGGNSSSDILSSDHASGPAAEKLDLRSGLGALTHLMSWFSAILFFSKNVALSSLPLYFPSILEGLGFSTIESQIYTVPPYACGVLFSLVAAFAGDRYGQRGALGAAMAILSAAGYSILATATAHSMRYFACFLVSMGLSSFAPLLYFWLVSNSPDHSQRGVSLVILGTIGHCGPFLGTTLFPEKDGPTYHRVLFSYLDRTSIGNAKTTMVKDLGLSDHQFVWLLTIFYIGFTLFQFLLISYSLFPPRKYVAICIGLWGICATLQGAGQNWATYMALRLGLGIAEAGFSSGAAYFFSTLYPRREAGFRFSIFLSAGSFASSWAGTLAYALMRHSGRLAGWRALFLVEGCLTVGFAPFVWFLLPNNTATAWFLNERERRIASARVLNEHLLPHDGVDDQSGVAGEDSRPKPRGDTFRDLFSTKDAMGAFKYPLSYVTAALFFFNSMALSPFSIYLPTILEGLGRSTAQSQGYSVPPFLCAFATSLIAAFFCDRYGCRGVVSGAMLLLGAGGYVMLALVDNVHARYGAAFIIAIATCTSPPLIYFWMISNQFNHSKRGLSLVILGTLGEPSKAAWRKCYTLMECLSPSPKGQGGPFVGTRLFPQREGPRYQRGMLVCAGVLFLGFLIVVPTVATMYLANRRRQKAHPIQKPDSQEEADERERDLSRNGDQSVYCK
ncbi:hypothetical protein OC842_002935 [Tilletia horrida]|uniref:Major facilitator superfamily (MFS) profile domain-containing protein n=1 Tax=Tilletia horrida TaxID=155126 RepID=A0AAN6GEE9_9BASI|nr:hypothetical protein OC842_002935 [Tilletia horrida]